MKEKWITHSALAELWIGISLSGVIGQIILAVFFERKGYESLGWWTGIVIAILMALHMEKTLSDALECDEKTATALVRKGFFLRYAVVLIVIGVMMLFPYGDPLAAFAGVMMLKLSAYIQPLTHKLSETVCGKEAFFREDLSGQWRAEEEEKERQKQENTDTTI